MRNPRPAPSRHLPQKRLDELAAFGRRVLFIMQSDEDWSSETMDEISDAASEYGVAGRSTEGGYFAAPDDIKATSGAPIRRPRKVPR